jgi:hypothetical protein
VSRRSRNRLLGLWLATLAVLLVLAAALPGLTLLPERNYDLPQSTEPWGVLANLGWLFTVVLALYVLAFIMLTPKDLRWRLLYAVVALWLLAGLVVLVVWLTGEREIQVIPEPAPIPSATATPGTPDELPPEEYGPVEGVAFTPPQRWVRVLVLSSVAVVCVGLILIIAWFVYARYRPTAQPPLAQLATQAQAALDALSAGEHVRDVVLRCYFEMARVLDENQGLHRVETATPREFAARLAAWGLPEEPVHTLTRLFEEARYGRRPADDAMVQQAIDALERIVAAVETMPAWRPV